MGSENSYSDGYGENNKERESKRELYIFSSGKKADFTNQAKYYQEKLEKETGGIVHLIETNSAKTFVQEWNKMNGDISNVMIIAHSNFHTIIFEHDAKTNALSTDGKGFSGQALDASISD